MNVIFDFYWSQIRGCKGPNYTLSSIVSIHCVVIAAAKTELCGLCLVSCVLQGEVSSQRESEVPVS